jgi:gliding motility associated protien GldN
MKKIWGRYGRLWCTLLLGLTCTCMVEAQSSVRRVPRKDNTATTATDKKTDKTANKTTATDKKDKAAPAQPAAAKNDNNTAAVKRTTTPAKNAKTATTATGEQGTLRAQAFDEYQRRDAAESSWQRTVYRELDVTKGSNASLYYPEEPTDGLTNFFRVLLDLVVSGKVKAYEYLDGREVFSDKYLIKVTDMLQKFQIYYTEKPASGKAAAAITIDENDVPSTEVLSYFLKERWEFERTTSHYGPHVLALCPVLHRAGDFGGEAFKYPMFWVNYEDLRPYLRQQQIVSDGMNGAPRYTMEDFFNLTQYQGDIYKVQNLRGLSLIQQYPDADTLRQKRAEIDADLHRFGDSIWVSQPAPETATATSTRKSDARTQRATAATSTSETTTTTSTPSAATKETKLNRRTKATVDVAAAEAEKEAQQEALETKASRTGAARSVRRTR